MMHFILIYELAPHYLQDRASYRAEHLKLAWEAQARGEIVLAGALTDPSDRAVFVFQSDTDAAARAFAAADPYVKAGLVKGWSVRAWNTVVGEAAANPVRP